MNNLFKKNILIVRDFNTDKFFKNRQRSDWSVLTIQDFLKRSILKSIISFLFNRYKYSEAVIGISTNLTGRNLNYLVTVLLFFIRADNKYFIDNKKNIQKFFFWRFVFIDTPLFVGELVFDLLSIVFSWVALFIFNILPKKKGKNNFDSKTIIYFRTDNFRGMQQGGSFTHFRGVVKGFDKLGYKIHYIGSGRIEVPNLNFLQDIIPYPNKFNLPEVPEIYYNWKFIPRGYKIIKTIRQNQDIKFIYQRHSIFNVCGAILSQLTGIPLVLEFNGSEPWVRQKWGGLLIFKKLCYFFENICLKKAHLISVVSQPIKNELLKQGISGDKILVNYNGVDSEKFNPDIDGSAIRKKLGLEGKIIVGTLSTFGVWHGTKVFSQVAKPIIEKYPIQNTQYPIHFLFIGDGVLRPECERIIQESEMGKHVTFTGTVPFTEIQQYLATCDILVASHIPNFDGTPFFGSPTKLFEYMAMGKGIVASDLDQIGEVLEHKKTAWLVKPGDVNDLVNGIIKLAKDKKLREELGKNAREEVVQNYTWEQNTKRIISSYLEIN